MNKRHQHNQSKSMTTETEIAEAALAAFASQTRIDVTLNRLEESPSGAISGNVQIKEYGVELHAVIKKSAAQSHLGSLIDRVRQTGSSDKTLLLADYINPRMAVKLKEADIQFADTVGNAYLSQPPLFIYIRGNKKAHNSSTRLETGLAFQRAGMKVIYALLENPNLVQSPYREIAERAGVALGAVTGIMKDLAAQGFVTGAQSRLRQLNDRDRLLDKWVEAYPARIKAKHLIGLFTTDTPDWHKTLNMHDLRALWGGEIAAEYYTDYLTPRDATLYIDRKDLPALANTARLRRLKPHEEVATRIEVMAPFWNTKQSPKGTKEDLAPPLVVYADLIATGDPRNLDAAGRIRERYLD